MNIFEGSRRIVKLISAAIVVGFGVAAFFVDPGVNIEYVVASPTSIPQRIDIDNCPTDSSSQYVYPRTRKNTKAYVKLCFTTQTFKDSKTGNDVQLIPYKFDEKTKMTWGAQSYSTEVTAYQRKVANSFVLPAEDERWVDDQYWSLVFVKLRNGFIAMIITLAILWAFTWAVGWIVRGFMGIPRGQDAKLKESK